MLSKLDSYQKSLLVAGFISLAVATFFVFWFPHKDNDLYQYFKWLDNLRLFRIDELFSFAMSRAEVVTTSYMLVIAKTGLYGLLQFFPTVISLFIIQYIALNVCRLNKISIKYAWLAIFVFFGAYEIFLVPSGIRSTLGFSLLSLALYFDFYRQNKKASLILYVLAPLVHLGVLLPLIIRLIMYRGLRIQITVYLFIFILIVVGIGPWMASLSVGDIYQNIITANIYKLGNYLTPFAPISVAYFYKIGKLLTIFFAAIYIYRRNSQNKMVRYILVLSILTVFMLPVYFIWYRLLELLVILSPVLILEYFSLKGIGARVKRSIIVLLIIVSLIGWRVEVPYYTSENFKIKSGMPTYNNWKDK